MLQLATQARERFAYGLPSSPFSPGQLTGVLTELQEIAVIPSALDGHATAELTPAATARLRAVAAEILGWSISLLMPNLIAASQHAARAHKRRRGSQPKGNTWEDAEQETVLRMMERLMDLAEEPVQNLRSYAFITMRSVLAAWDRRSASAQVHASVSDLESLPAELERHDPAAGIVLKELEDRLARSATPVGGLPLDRVFNAVVRHDYSFSKAAEELKINEPKLCELWEAALSLIAPVVR